jgi:hypothetical protein
MFHLKGVIQQGKAAHTCHPSYLGGWDREDWGLRPAPANSSQDLISKITNGGISRAVCSIKTLEEESSLSLYLLLGIPDLQIRSLQSLPPWALTSFPQVPLFCKDTSLGLEPTLIHVVSSYLNYIHKGPSSKEQPLMSLSLQHVFLGGCNSVHNTGLSLDSGMNHVFRSREIREYGKNT